MRPLLIPGECVLTHDEAVTLVREVLARIWETTGRAVPGSRLKATVVTEARNRGQAFDERGLGYSGFVDFVRQNSLAEILERSGTDVLLAPRGLSTELARQATDVTPLRIRREFWDAFLRFSERGRLRAYDPKGDAILDLPATGAAPAGSVPISPADREEQIEWRRQFLRELGDHPVAAKADELTVVGGFADFSALLSDLPDIRSSWYRRWRDRVEDVIRGWARANGVPEGVWLERSPRGTDDQIRRRVYQLLDQVPADRLLDLQLPIRWLLEGPD